MDFVDHIRAERADLTTRIDKLADFIHSTTFNTLDPTDQTLLQVQLRAMQNYLFILNTRLRRLETPKPAPLAEIGEPVEVGGHDIDRDGPIPFST